MTDLNEIFNTLQPILAKYSPPFSVMEPSTAIKRSGKRFYALESLKEVVIAGQPKKSVYFAGLIVQKDYVGFYYMLAYSNPEITSKLDKDFLKLLKGKSCFYIRDTGPKTIKEIKKALDLGLKEYQKRGWV